MPSLKTFREDHHFAHDNEDAVKKANASTWAAAYNTVMVVVRSATTPPGFPYPDLFKKKNIAFDSDADDGGYAQCFLDLCPVRHHRRIGEAVGKLFKRPPATE